MKFLFNNFVLARLSSTKHIQLVTVNRQPVALKPLVHYAWNSNKEGFFRTFCCYLLLFYFCYYFNANAIVVVM